MASIRFGAGIVDARGSISGMTFSRNASGAFIRSRTAPTNPNTSAQSQQRQRLGAISSTWRNLTSAQRQSWVTLASQTPRTNRLGEQGFLTGQQLYVRRNLIRAELEAPLLTAAPPDIRVPVIFAGQPYGFLQVNAAGELQDLYVDVELADADDPGLYAIALDATAPLSAGVIRPPDRDFRRLATIRVNNIPGGQVDVSGQYQSVYNVASFDPANVVWFQARAIAVPTGQQGTPARQRGGIAQA